MPSAIDLTGRKFERLTVLRLEGRRGRRLFWACKCDCGTEIAVRGSHLTSGGTLSCGCLHSERSSARTHVLHAANTKTGLSGSATYSVWCGMRSRCSNPRNAYYAYYGGRGIQVCERWQKFENFVTDMGAKPDGLTLDRIDNSRGYEPGNCRWVSRRIQQNNRRNNRILTYMGKTATIAEWASALGMKFNTLHNRLDTGWSVAKALATPVKKR